MNINKLAKQKSKLGSMALTLCLSTLASAVESPYDDDAPCQNETYGTCVGKKQGALSLFRLSPLHNYNY